MNKFRFTIKALVFALFMVTFASVAHAQATRTWVSGLGDDANPCSRTAPCKTFAGAYSRTAAGGEIDAYDPGGFGAVTISKALTIDGGGGQVASILPGGANGIVVTAGPNDVVTLVNLRFQGVGTGINAIRFLSGKRLNVVNDYIYGFSQNGIDVALTADGSSVFVKDTLVKNCAGDGIAVTTTVGTVKATLESSSFVENGNGLHAKNMSRVIARNCDFSSNNTNGVWADGASFATARVWQSQISLNGSNGVQAGNAGDNASGVEIAQNQINNNTGSGVLITTGGVVETFSNNSIRGNGTDGCASCAPVGPGN